MLSVVTPSALAVGDYGWSYPCGGNRPAGWMPNVAPAIVAPNVVAVPTRVVTPAKRYAGSRDNSRANPSGRNGPSCRVPNIAPLMVAVNVVAMPTAVVAPTLPWSEGGEHHCCSDKREDRGFNSYSHVFSFRAIAR